MTARPFIKWVGGKGQLLDQIRPHVPASFRTYREPFVGGGALFFALAPKRAVLGDSNSDLIATYTAVRDRVDDVIAVLREMPYDRGLYYATRSRFNASRPTTGQAGLFAPVAVDPAERAAWMIYLIRTGFNGLWRVNSAGEHNVSWGRYDNPLICDEENLRACSAALQNAELRCEDFRVACRRAAPGDLVFLDSPYLPATATASFTGYTAGGFGARDFEALRRAFVALTGRGVHVLATNAPHARHLYPGARFIETSRGGGMNSDPTKRGRVKEILAVHHAAAVRGSAALEAPA